MAFALPLAVEWRRPALSWRGGWQRVEEGGWKTREVAGEGSSRGWKMETSVPREHSLAWRVLILVRAWSSLGNHVSGSSERASSILARSVWAASRSCLVPFLNNLSSLVAIVAIRRLISGQWAMRDNMSSSTPAVMAATLARNWSSRAGSWRKPWLNPTIRRGCILTALVLVPGRRRSRVMGLWSEMARFGQLRVVAILHDLTIDM
eukprot:jgi/Picsp_1/3235/NSC_06075-R1_---NA---